MATLHISPTYLSSFPDNWRWRPDTTPGSPAPPSGQVTDDQVQENAYLAVRDAEGMGRTHRSWVGTVNNPSHEELRILVEDLDTTYIVIGAEVGDSGTPHLQLCMTMKRPYRWNGFKNRLNELGLSRMYFAPVNKSVAAARQYCKKDGHVYEKRSTPGQGHRTDLDSLVSLCRDVANNKRTWSDAFDDPLLSSSLFRYSAHASRAHAMMVVPTPRTHWTRGVWLHGPPGCGKSSWVLQAFPQAEFITWTPQGFMNGYTGLARVVVMDDEALDLLPISLIKRMVNRTKVTINVKNQSKLWWNPEIIIFISNFPVESMRWWNQDAEETDQHGYTAVQSRFFEHRQGYCGEFTRRHHAPGDLPDWLLGEGPAAGDPIVNLDA